MGVLVVEWFSKPVESGGRTLICKGFSKRCIYCCFNRFEDRGSILEDRYCVKIRSGYAEESKRNSLELINWNSDVVLTRGKDYLSPIGCE